MSVLTAFSRMTLNCICLFWSSWGIKFMSVEVPCFSEPYFPILSNSSINQNSKLTATTLEILNTGIWECWCWETLIACLRYGDSLQLATALNCKSGIFCQIIHGWNWNRYPVCNPLSTICNEIFTIHMIALSV